MSKRKHNSPEALDGGLLPKQRKPIPHAFVLDAISTLSPYTRPMFGCLAIYVRDKIVLILRDKPTNAADNGVWLATTEEHHQSLLREFPNMRSIQVLGKPVTGWQVLPADAPDFESSALRACELVLAGDPRIGKVPSARASKSSKAAGMSAKGIKTSKKHGSTIDFDTVRKIGLALSGVEESTAYGSPALKVRGKLLASVPAHRSAEPNSLVVRVDFDDRAELLATAPDVYYVTDHYLGYSAVLVRLSRVTPDVLRDLLGMAHKFVTAHEARSPRSRNGRRSV
ncbi:MAG TPA: MmcQ/YjbR family DNA-binding protein [Terriglobales bacterium]|nr:MmcQ/YjbR family DNA-binding protein [Terriglobales bacterium]